MKNKLKRLFSLFLLFIGLREETVAQRAYRLLKDVPEDQWTVGITNNKDKCCFLGHYQRLITNPKNYNYNSLHLGYNSDISIKSDEFLRIVHKCNRKGFEVNDHVYVNGYNQPVIKDRVMALLKDMIAHGY